jgi:hypothetical protein
VTDEAASDRALAAWLERRSIYGWDADEASWWAQLWRNDLPDDPVADAPHIGLGPLYGQRIGEVSLLIYLIAKATGHDFDTVDQVMLATDASDGDRLQITLPSGRTHHGTCRAHPEAKERADRRAPGQPVHAVTLELDNGETIDLVDLALRAGSGEARVGLSHEPQTAG